jgi:hypothetical protein
MDEPISKEEFLGKKRDFSPLLVHLTRDRTDENGESILAFEVLQRILSENELKAFNPYCIFNSKLRNMGSNLRDKFNVVCFTETPIDQIDLLLQPVYGRDVKLAPFGLVFTKKDIRDYGGNPVLYLRGDLSSLLWKVFDKAAANDFSEEENELLALVSKCDESIDFHWEREWRIVGNLTLVRTEIWTNIYCGLCPEEHIQYFENTYTPVKFISPNWGINKILDKLVKTI